MSSKSTCCQGSVPLSFMGITDLHSCGVCSHTDPGLGPVFALPFKEIIFYLCLCVCLPARAHACKRRRCLCRATDLSLELQALVSSPTQMLGTAPAALITVKSSISLAHCAGFVPEMAMGNLSSSAICCSHAAQSIPALSTTPVT